MIGSGRNAIRPLIRHSEAERFNRCVRFVAPARNRRAGRPTDRRSRRGRPTPSSTSATVGCAREGGSTGRREVRTGRRDRCTRRGRAGSVRRQPGARSRAAGRSGSRADERSPPEHPAVAVVDHRGQDPGRDGAAIRRASRGGGFTQFEVCTSVRVTVELSERRGRRQAHTRSRRRGRPCARHDQSNVPARTDQSSSARSGPRRSRPDSLSS